MPKGSGKIAADDVPIFSRHMRRGVVIHSITFELNPACNSQLYTFAGYYCKMNMHRNIELQTDDHTKRWAMTK